MQHTRYFISTRKKKKTSRLVSGAQSLFDLLLSDYLHEHESAHLLCTVLNQDTCVRWWGCSVVEEPW